MHKLALLAILLTARAGDDSLQQLVEDLRQEAREEFESMAGIDASELDGYVDAFVADGLARITRRVSMEIDDDGEAQAQFKADKAEELEDSQGQGGGQRSQGHEEEEVREVIVNGLRICEDAVSSEREASRRATDAR